MSEPTFDPSRPASKRIALIAQRPSDFVEMRRAGEALAARGHAVTFLYHTLSGAPDQNEMVLRQLRRMQEEGKYGPPIIVGPDSGTPTERLRKRLKRRAVDGRENRRSPGHLMERFRTGSRIRRFLAFVMELPSLYARATFVVASYGMRYAYYRRWLSRLKPDIILLPEDVVGYVTPLVIRAAHHLNIPSLILPYTVANQREAFQGLRTQQAYQLARPANRLAALLFPRWQMRAEGARILRLPAPYVLGHLLTRTSPPDPWMMNSGFADRIAVENKVMFDYYRRAGIPASKMEVVGAVADDDLARLTRNKPRELRRLRSELGLDGDRPLLLIGGFPDQRSVAPGFDFPGYEELVDHILDSLAPLRRHYTILVRPHPNFPGLRPLFESRDIPCTTIDTARLVALADAYIAFASATIRWSIACGIPSVNYDAFHYDYDDYKGVPGVLNVSRPDEFRQAVLKLAPNTPDHQALMASAEAERGRWGNLDGRSVERIEALMVRLCNQRSGTATSRPSDGPSNGHTACAP